MRGHTPLKVIADKAGLDDGTLGNIITKTTPSAEKAVRLARALGTTVEYLFTGEDTRGGVGLSPAMLALRDAMHRAPSATSTPAGLIDAASADWLMLPRYDLFAWSDDEKPEPVEIVPFRRDWLARRVLTTAKLWIATMPSDAMPQIASEGEPIICKDIIDRLADGRTYIFRLAGQPIVRRVALRPDGFVLTTGDGSAEQLLIPHDADPAAADVPHPIGRILAALTIRPV